MKYCCNECGNIFDEEYVSEYREYHHEIPGNFYESWGVSPCCGADFTNAYDCEICGEAYNEEEMSGTDYHVCPLCLKDYRRDFETCFEIADEAGNDCLCETDPINATISTCFSRRQIEYMIRTYIREHEAEFDGEEFISNDPDWFADCLVEKIKKRKEAK